MNKHKNKHYYYYQERSGRAHRIFPILGIFFSYVTWFFFFSANKTKKKRILIIIIILKLIKISTFFQFFFSRIFSTYEIGIGINNKFLWYLNPISEKKQISCYDIHMNGLFFSCFSCLDDENIFFFSTSSLGFRGVCVSVKSIYCLLYLWLLFVVCFIIIIGVLWTFVVVNI